IEEPVDDEVTAHIERTGRRKAQWHQKIDAVCEQYHLSPREREILPILLRGRDAKYIMDTFYISQSTAKTHIYNIYRKFGIHSRQELLDFVEDIEFIDFGVSDEPVERDETDQEKS
ncbi:MAG: response regulator transcription factor, partial [Bacteroidales bacterium]